jgi:hypothetical protein
MRRFSEKKSVRLLRTSVVGLAGLLLISTPALAGNKSGAANRPAREKAARKACLSGDYGKGVEILSELFVDTKDPTYLFNQGRCFEQNRRYEDAIARFQEYLRAAQGKLEESDRLSAEQHIADCKTMLPAQTPPIVATPETFVPPPPPQPVVTTPGRVVTSQPAESVDTGLRPASKAGKSLRVAGIITASIGAAGVVTGLVLNLSANAAINEMESSRDGYSPSKESSQKGLKTGALVCYGVGAGLVVTGAILYGIGVAKGAPSRNVAVLPTVGVGHAGAAIVGAF